jgi:hypothetical protein
MFDVRLPNSPTIKLIPEGVFEDVVDEIQAFQAVLTDEQELGVVANGAGLVLHVEQLRLEGQIMIFTGVDGEGRPARLVQHYTQCNVLLMAVNKISEQPRRIGF